MKELTSRGPIDEESVVHYIFECIADDIEQKLFLYEAKDYKQLKSKLEVYEKFKNSKRLVHSSGSKYFKNFRHVSVTNETKPKSTSPPAWTRGPRCYNYNGISHIVSQYPKLRRGRGTGYEYYKSDHVAVNCPTKEVSVGRTSTSTIVIHANLNLIPPDMTNVKLLVKDLDKDSNLSVINFKAIVDSGSPICLVKSSFLPNSNFNELCSSKEFTGINLSKNNVLGIYNVLAKVEDDKLQMRFHVISDETMCFDALLDRDFMYSPYVKLSFDNGIKIQ